MSKIVPLKDLLVPVNAAIPAANHLIVYFGVHPLDTTTVDASTGGPALYGSKDRIDCGPVSGLKTVTNPTDSAGTALTGAYWDLSALSAQLPAGLSGSYDFVVTDMEAPPAGQTVGNESDFSGALTTSVDTVVPPTPGTPVQL